MNEMRQTATRLWARHSSKSLARASQWILSRALTSDEEPGSRMTTQQEGGYVTGDAARSNDGVPLRFENLRAGPGVRSDVNPRAPRRTGACRRTRRSQTEPSRVPADCNRDGWRNRRRYHANTDVVSDRRSPRRSCDRL